MATYGKASVLAAAHTAGEEIRAERTRLCKVWDAHTRLWYILNFFKFMEYEARPDNYGYGAEQTANRLVWKATNATENSIDLTDYEIDVLREYWG